MAQLGFDIALWRCEYNFSRCDDKIKVSILPGLVQRHLEGRSLVPERLRDVLGED